MDLTLGRKGIVLSQHLRAQGRGNVALVQRDDVILRRAQQSIVDHPVTFLQADTGAGKTTQVGQLAAEVASDLYH